MLSEEPGVLSPVEPVVGLDDTGGLPVSTVLLGTEDSGASSPQELSANRDNVTIKEIISNNVSNFLFISFPPKKVFKYTNLHQIGRDLYTSIYYNKKELLSSDFILF